MAKMERILAPRLVRVLVAGDVTCCVSMTCSRDVGCFVSKCFSGKMCLECRHDQEVDMVL